ncbi:putative reverse transcriptase domain-containing protein [Tanacetum coccineum]
MCVRMFLEEFDKVEKYVGGLPDMIQGSVMASKPKTMQEAIEFATELMDQKIHTFADRQADNKRKLDDNSRNNQTKPQPYKRQNVARAYTAGPGEKKEYGGSLPLCTKCNCYHNGLCAPRCNNCKKVGHLTRDCRGSAAATNNQRAPGENQRVVTCIEYGVQGHYKKDCPKLKNKNRGNQTINGGATARAYVVGSARTNPNSNVVMVRMTKVIKGEFEKIKDIMVKDDSLACDSPLEVFNCEVSRLSKMDDDLFTYEVEIANTPCNLRVDDDLEHEADDMGFDPSDIAFTKWLGSKFFNYKTMDHYTMKALWIYWIRGDDEVELIDEEFSDNEDEISEVFRIDTNIFDYETPICSVFNEFNYLLKVYPDLLTKDIMGIKTYDDYKDDWIYECNKDVPWVDDKPWTDTGVWT